MMEDYVSFETAQLLKEKGFDWEVHRSYLVNDNFYAPADVNDLPNRKDAIRIPTLQMAMKWLREAHHIFIRVIQSNIEYCACEIYYNRVSHYEFRESFNSYEEACEEVIRYSLRNLI